LLYKFFFILGLSFSSWVFAKDAQIFEVKSTEYLYKNSTSVTYEGVFRFPLAPTVHEKAFAWFCSQDADKLTKVSLHMEHAGDSKKQMKHGSAPTHLFSSPETYFYKGKKLPCRGVKNMEFFMAGKWKLRLEFKDGALAYINEVNVPEPKKADDKKSEHSHHKH